MTEASAIVQRVWNYCNVLRDGSVSYGDYLEQLTYLPFLKMADELEQEYGEETHILAVFRWSDLVNLIYTLTTQPVSVLSLETFFCPPWRPIRRGDPLPGG